jgi:hypothetical protein
MTDNTPERIALDLLWLIAETEGKTVYVDGDIQRRTLSADRAWILSTYKSCLETVKSTAFWKQGA